MPNAVIGGTAGRRFWTGCNRRQCCRTTVAFLFSHIGLTALVVAYSVMGAFLFQHLEQEYELKKVGMIKDWKSDAVENIWEITTDMHLERSLQDHCTTSCEPIKSAPVAQALRTNRANEVLSRMHAVKAEMLESLWNLTLDLNVLWKENWTMLADKHASGFFRKAQNLLEEYTGAGVNSEPANPPQIHCSTTCAVSMNSSLDTKRNWTSAVAGTIELFQDNITEAIRDGFESQKAHTKWTFSSSFLYALSVITTIGYGHVTPKTTQGKIVTVIYAVVGIPIMLLFLANIGDFLARIFRGIFTYISRCQVSRTARPARRRPGRRSQERGGKKRPRLRNVGHNANETLTSTRPAPLAPLAATWSDVDTDEEIVELPRDEGKKEASNSVPVLGCLVIMGTYLFGGAMLFALWEDWPYLDAFYFCFVTLTTIGFGDFVPGATMLNNDTSSQKLVVCCVYVLVGLALIACCFNLMQEQVRWYATTMARFLGFLEDAKVEENVIQTERVDLDA